MTNTASSFDVPMYGEVVARRDDSDQFAQPYDRGSSSGLKKFIEAEGNRQEGPGQVHLPDDVVGSLNFDGQQWNCRFTFKGKAVQATGETRDAAIMAGAKYISGMTAEKEIRELSEAQLNYVGSLAQGGRLIEAIEKYLSFSIANKNLSPRTILSDPKYSETCDQAAWFVWSRANNEYSLSDDKFPFFLERFAAGKRFTIELLSVAWNTYKQQATQEIVATKFGETKDPAQIAEGLEDMSDQEISETFWKTARHVARAAA